MIAERIVLQKIVDIFHKLWYFVVKKCFSGDHRCLACFKSCVGALRVEITSRLFLVVRSRRFLGGGEVHTQSVGPKRREDFGGSADDYPSCDVVNSNIEFTAKERRISRVAVLEPLFFSAVFCVVELLVPLFHASPDNFRHVSFYLQTLWAFVDTFIGYFAATLIAMVVFMLLQQYYYKCFAGIDDDKAIFPLGTVFVLYLIFYVLYLALKHIVLKWLLLVLTIMAAHTVWTSLREDVQKIDNRNGTKAYVATTFTGQS